jgi:hypothetical protein
MPGKPGLSSEHGEPTIAAPADARDDPVMTPPEEAVRRPLATDVRALIGILAVLEGQLLGESNSDALPPRATRLAGRLERDGLPESRPVG